MYDCLDIAPHQLALSPRGKSPRVHSETVVPSYAILVLDQPGCSLTRGLGNRVYALKQ